MALIKRSVIVAGALAALTACAPAGYNPNNPTGDAQQVAAAGGTAAPTATAADEGTGAAPRTQTVALTEKLIAKKLPRMGAVVTDQEGWVLYRFDKDSANPPTSNCVDDCARVWPPALTDGNARLQGVTDDRIGTIDRPDGTKQLTVGGWAVYRYIGDTKPGQWKGQGVGNTWWVITPDGKKNLTCVPKTPPKAVAPPPLVEATPSGASGASGGGDYSY
ncbi:hypothetical protein [Plantactinospora sp. KBS50]|uniref:hypothetical protein n=1 Tax=Plantactinospora sp. KBS50 TaxID=2024580 RepID=UPI000BAB0FAD|nr:hypothetical protein [Plantactinospora sp. KBS50]ASW54218.1 hypothetical protein CIK06_08430 [Plantactinospora sp. KBS50]